MPDWVRYAVFFGVLVVLVGLSHRYLYLRLVRDPAPHGRWRRLGARLVPVLALGMLLGVGMSRLLPRDAARMGAFAAYFWMGVLALLLPALIAGDLVRAGRGLLDRLRMRDTGAIDAERRLFLARGTAAVATVGSVGLAGAGVHTALSTPEVRSHTVPLERLPPAFDGLRVVQLSDVHVGPTIGRGFVEALVAQVNALAPDLVVITGDLVDGTVARLGADTAPLAGLRSRFGTFFATGNHDHYSGAEAWTAELRRLGITVLRNGFATVEKDGQALDLVGVDDFSFRGRGGYDFAAAVAGRDPERPAILLSHQPKGIHDAATHGVDLVLSGHTHGGQIWPYGFFVRFIQPYTKGLHRHTHRTWIYVHCGTGYWGPPVRVGVPAEVAVLTLTRSVG